MDNISSQKQLLSKIQGKYLHFTIQNWTEIDIPDSLPKQLSFLIMGKEIAPTTGTSHLQCYCIAASKDIRGTVIKKLFPNASNITKEYARGSISQSVTYCMKEDPNPTIFGVQPPDQKPGKRSDLEQVYEQISSGATSKQIMQDDFPTWARNYKAIEKAIELSYEPKLYRPDLKVIYKYGETGLGKTYDTTQTEYPGCYVKPVGKGLWFDNYEHEEVVLIDEFRGQWPLSDVLQILDNLSPLVERKGSHVRLDANTLVLCSNDHPSTMYESHKEGSRKAFLRRLAIIHYYISRNNYIILDEDQRKSFINNPEWVPKSPPTLTVSLLKQPTPHSTKKRSSKEIVEKTVQNTPRYYQDSDGSIKKRKVQETDDEYYKSVPSKVLCLECEEYYCDCHNQ